MGPDFQSLGCFQAFAPPQTHQRGRSPDGTTQTPSSSSSVEPAERHMPAYQTSQLIWGEQKRGRLMLRSCKRCWKRRQCVNSGQHKVFSAHPLITMPFYEACPYGIINASLRYLTKVVLVCGIKLLDWFRFLRNKYCSLGTKTTAR